MFSQGRRRSDAHVSHFPLFLFGYSVSVCSVWLSFRNFFHSIWLEAFESRPSLQNRVLRQQQKGKEQNHKRFVLRKLLATLRGLRCLVVTLNKKKEKHFNSLEKIAKGLLFFFFVVATTTWPHSISSKQMSPFQQTSWGFTEHLHWAFFFDETAKLYLNSLLYCLVNLWHHYWHTAPCEIYF